MLLLTYNITALLAGIAFNGYLPIFILMIADIATGLIVAWKCAEIESNKMTNGLAKKATLLVALIIGYFVDTIIAGGTPMFRPMIVTYILANEGLSVVENLGKLGVPVPKFIKFKLKSLKGSDEVLYKDSSNEAFNQLWNVDTKGADPKIKTYQDGSKECFMQNFYTEGLCDTCAHTGKCINRAKE